MTPQEQDKAMKEMYEIQDAFNTGYNLAQSLDDPNISDKDKATLSKIKETIEKSSPESEKFQTMKEGFEQFRKDKQKEMLKHIQDNERKGRER